MRKSLRRVMLVVLDPRPRWWASVRFWGIVATGLVITAAATSPVPELAIGYSWSVKRDSARGISWGWDPDSDAQNWSLSGGYRVDRGPGYERFESIPPTFGAAYPGPSIPNAETQRAVVAWIVSNWPRRAESTRTSELEHWKVRSLELWLAGGSVEVHRRWWNWLLVGARWTGVGLLIVIPGVWYLRATQAAWFRQQLSRLSQGRCPCCAYDLSATPSGRCPECGADAVAVRREAVNGLRKTRFR